MHYYGQSAETRGAQVGTVPGESRFLGTSHVEERPLGVKTGPYASVGARPLGPHPAAVPLATHLGAPLAHPGAPLAHPGLFGARPLAGSIHHNPWGSRYGPMVSGPPMDGGSLKKP